MKDFIFILIMCGIFIFFVAGLIYYHISWAREKINKAYKRGYSAFKQEFCEKCEVGNPCIYCEHDFSQNKTSTDEPMTMVYPTIFCEDAISRLDKIRQIIAIPNSVIQEDVMKYKMICEVMNDDYKISRTKSKEVGRL